MEADLNHDRLPGIVNGIVTDGQLVYSGFGKALCALDVESGDELWRNKAWVAVTEQRQP